MRTSGNDPRIDQAIEILQGGRPRQDSIEKQLQDVLALAEAAGCRDALELIKRTLGK